MIIIQHPISVIKHKSLWNGHEFVQNRDQEYRLLQQQQNEAVLRLIEILYRYFWWTKIFTDPVYSGLS